MLVRFVFATAVLLSTASFAGAQSNTAMRDACMGDFQKFCATVKPGGGRILTCLRQNAEKLSPVCRSALDQAKSK